MSKSYTYLMVLIFYLLSFILIFKVSKSYFGRVTSENTLPFEMKK